MSERGGANFVKLQRFVVTCSACGKRADCMAVDAAAAGVKFYEDALNKRITELETENSRLLSAITEISELTREFSYDRTLL